MEQSENVSNETIYIDFQCVNCDQIFPISKPRLYCSNRCQQDAKLVRYSRTCNQNGKINQPDVQMAIRIRFAFALSKTGYYDEKARRLSAALRKQIIERDVGLCCKCGEQGNQIDHIHGSSSEMENLQLLCLDCHIEKTKTGFVEVTPDHKRYEEIKSRADNLRFRINASIPQRTCDDAANWRKIFSLMMLEQRQLLKKIKEDLDGTGIKDNTFEKEVIAQEIVELSELYQEREKLELQKQDQIDQVLTSDIKLQIEQIEADFAERAKNIDGGISNLEKRVKLDVARYGATVKGGCFRAVYYKGRVSWDTKSLEEYAKLHPEILRFRKEGASSVRVSKVDK